MKICVVARGDASGGQEAFLLLTVVAVSVGNILILGEFNAPEID